MLARRPHLGHCPCAKYPQGRGLAAELQPKSIFLRFGKSQSAVKKLLLESNCNSGEDGLT